MIINGRQSRSGRFFDLLFTLLGWSLVLYFAYQFVLLVLRRQPALVIDWLRVDADVMNVVLITLAVTGASTSLLWGWAAYNQWRYGALRRRSMPRDVTVADLTRLFRTPESVVDRLQSEVWVDLGPDQSLEA